MNPVVEEFRGEILFCPCCCSPVDVSVPGQTGFECVNCGQTWTMAVNSERQAEFSIH